MRYFGEPWPGAPEKPAATPVGAPCSICTLRFIPDDRGMLGGEMRGTRRGGIEGRYVVAHRECYMLDKIGHDEGVCECTRGRRSPHEKRADALALWARVAEE